MLCYDGIKAMSCCFSWGQTSDKVCQDKKSLSSFFILDKKNEELFILKMLMARY